MSLMGGALIVIASSDHQGNNSSDEYQQTFYVAETALMQAQKSLMNKMIGPINTTEGTRDLEGRYIPRNGDSDGDGVSDNVDQCPNSENGATVSWNGCKVTVQENEDSSTEDDSSSIPGFAAVTALISILFAIRIGKETDE